MAAPAVTVDRVAGALVGAFGAALLAWIVPAQTEAVDYGWLRPQSLPHALGVALIGLGLAQAALVRGTAAPAIRPVLLAALYLALATLAGWAMGRLGFVWVAPAMMAVLMGLIGERRPLWLGLGVVAMPALVWGVVVGLLDRTLPG